jgi:predicted DNA-binding transcriptional regulator YafY
MGHWRFITNHARTLLCIAHDPGVRLRDIAAMVGVTERSAHDMVSDLVDAGYVIKDKDGRRNQYRIQEHVPLRDPISQEPTIGEMLNLLVGVNAHRNPYKPRHYPRWLSAEADCRRRSTTPAAERSAAWNHSL